MLPTVILIWAAFLLLAALYVRRARHARQKPLAAFLIFVMVFTVAAFFMFGILTYLAQIAGWLPALEHPAGATAFLILIFAPALALARWQIRRPPRHTSPPE